ncbi:hypothetical protein GCM10027040_24330 [Halomonas shantousis]
MKLDIIDPPIERAKDLQPGDQAQARAGNRALTLKIIERHPDSSYRVQLLEGGPPSDTNETASEGGLTAHWFNFVRIRQQGNAEWDDGLSFPDEKPDTY